MPFSSSSTKTCGMGTPDVLGTQGTFQHWAEDGPEKTVDPGGGRKSRIQFENDTAQIEIMGPENTLLKKPRPIVLKALVHRDKKANAAVLQIGEKRIVLKPGQFSHWTQLEFTIDTPSVMPSETVSGICRILLQEVAPNFRLYISPINHDPRSPAVQLSEPKSFVSDLAKKVGPFTTTGFPEDHRARVLGAFELRVVLENEERMVPSELHQIRLAEKIAELERRQPALRRAE